MDVGICVEAWLIEFREEEAGVPGKWACRGLAELGGVGYPLRLLVGVSTALTDASACFSSDLGRADVGVVEAADAVDFRYGLDELKVEL